MENFTMNNPTILHFGRNVVEGLGKAVSAFGPNVLLVYGKGSIKRNGIYEQVVGQMKNINARVFEYQGIKPNPLSGDVDAAAKVGKKNKVDVILAVGGGSVIDSAKIIALAIPGGDKAWDIMTNKVKPKTAVPVIAILTLAATGTEMNPFAVLQNVETRQKIGYGNPLVYPRHSFLDPAYTFSVPKDYTAYGIVDLIAHALENYFGQGEASLSDRFVYAIIREAMEYGPALLDDLMNYDLRAKIMYAATNALNGLTVYGRVSGDWGVHDMGHVLSLLYDTPHGATLSMVYPAWLKVMKERIPERIAELGKALFGVENAEDTIVSLETFFTKIEAPIRLGEVGLTRDKLPEIIERMKKNAVNGMHHKLAIHEIEKIVNLMI